MTMQDASRPKFAALRYHNGARNNKTAKKQYLQWRKIQEPPLPDRCDNPDCMFHTGPLEWNGKKLPLILDHKDGVNTDNRPSQLRLYCPNCDALNAATRGGANAGKTIKSDGGFSRLIEGGSKTYVLPSNGPAEFTLTGGRARMTVIRK